MCFSCDGYWHFCDFFFFSSRRRHTSWNCDWSSDVCSSDLPAQGRRAPELAVIAAARVEADDERRRADLRRERLEVGGQVEAAALLAAFDQDHAAPVRALVLVQLLQCRDGAEHRVAVVRAA